MRGLHCGAMRNDLDLAVRINLVWHRIMLRASAVVQLIRLVELLAAGAVEAVISALVDVAALYTGRPKALGPRPVTCIGAGSDEVVEGQLKAFPERPEPGRVTFHQRRDWNARQLSGVDVLETVLVGTSQEPNIIARQPIEARQGVGLHHL